MRKVDTVRDLSTYIVKLGCQNEKKALDEGLSSLLETKRSLVEQHSRSIQEQAD